jgi:8-oxo-dGTP pyrophosphatase MutT (NUDIX family)
MNKKIYFNDIYLEVSEDETQYSQDQLIKIYKNSELPLEDLKEQLLKLKEGSIAIIVPSFKIFLKEFRKQFYYIEAAGGFIQKENSFLFIHRHGRWDLPKGKLEKKETIEKAAIRECEEECGISNLMIQKPLPSTFHIYQYKDGYALKQTYWFYMTTNFAEALVPQTKESIDEVRWFTRDEVIGVALPDTYHTISDVVKDALDLR